MKVHLIPKIFYCKKKSTYIKLLVNNKNGLIIGAHMLGEEEPKIIQMIGVAINAKQSLKILLPWLFIRQ